MTRANHTTSPAIRSTDTALFQMIDRHGELAQTIAALYARYGDHACNRQGYQSADREQITPALRLLAGSRRADALCAQSLEVKLFSPVDNVEAPRTLTQ
jgi:hypothetical protein